MSRIRLDYLNSAQRSTGSLCTGMKLWIFQQLRLSAKSVSLRKTKAQITRVTSRQDLVIQSFWMASSLRPADQTNEVDAARTQLTIVGTLGRNGTQRLPWRGTLDTHQILKPSQCIIRSNWLLYIALLYHFSRNILFAISGMGLVRNIVYIKCKIFWSHEMVAATTVNIVSAFTWLHIFVAV